jgi:hypothetical protein
MAVKRSFNILDAIVLVASTAVGMALCIGHARIVETRANFDPPPPPGFVSVYDSLPFRVHSFCGYLTLLLFAWSIGFLLLRIRSPRARLRRLFRSPGAAACLAVFVYFIVRSADAMMTWLVNVVRPLDGYSVDWVEETLASPQQLGVEAGPAIAAVWAILALSRGIRFTRDWLEIFGLLLAFGWFLLLFEQPVCNFLWSLPA